MGNIENKASLRYMYKGKAGGMKCMGKGGVPHILDVTRIFTNTCDAVTSNHITPCRKSSGILSASDVADLTQIYVENIGNRAWGEEVAVVQCCAS